VKKCPDCAELVQDDARVCRFCKHEFNKAVASKQPSVQPPRQNKGGGLAAICIGIIVLVAIASSKGSGTNERPAAKPTRSNESAVKTEPKPESPYADAGKQAAWISNGQQSIKTQLKDPESATFRNVHFYSGGGTPVVCGEVNARNGFGGYTGFERFVAAGTVIAAVESQVEGGLGPVWDKFCKKANWDRM
jgi:hypothetical protein